MLNKSLSIGLLLVSALGFVAAGPTKGVINNSEFRVPASRDEGAPGEADIVEEFRGNQKASVLVKGDHRPITDLEVLVFEVSTTGGEDKLVARDKGTKDIVGVVWTPPRTGMYRIVVRNPSKFHPEKNPYNSCYVTIR